MKTALPAIGPPFWRSLTPRGPLQALGRSPNPMEAQQGIHSRAGRQLEGRSALREEHTRNKRRGRRSSMRCGKLKFPPGQCFTWVAVPNPAPLGRSAHYLTDEAGLRYKHWIKAAGLLASVAQFGTHDSIRDTE